MLEKVDTYRDECKKVGSLGATLPAWVRNICRTRIDGTHILVLEEQKKLALKELEKYEDKYEFCRLYHDIMEHNSAEDVYDLTLSILDRSKKTGNILDTLCKMEGGLNHPKVSCLSCRIPRVVIDSLAGREK